MSQMEQNSKIRPVINEKPFKDITKTKVLISTINDKKCISDVITKLNKEFPLTDNLLFLKRIHKNDIILGELSVRERFESEFSKSLLFSDIREVEVPNVCPKTRAQYDQARKLWPCIPRFDRKYEQLIKDANFSNNDLQLLTNWMTVAVFVAKFSTNHNVGAIIVDQKSNICIAVGFDSRTKNPCQHAVMVAIDNVAKAHGFYGAWPNYNSSTKHSPNNSGLISKQIENQLKNQFPDMNFDYNLKNKKRSFDETPYLCTNYDCYVTQEPCLMCSMALVHSRISRVFFGSKNVQEGALESSCNLHFIRELNHHFQVFGGLLESECNHLNK